jgi:hypothetical protein
MAWRFENGGLYLGDTVTKDGCTMPALRHAYDEPIASMLQALVIGDDCYIYSTEFPILEVWGKHIDSSRTYAGCSFSTLAHPQDVEIWHARKRASFPIMIRDEGEVGEAQILAAITQREYSHGPSVWEQLFDEEDLVRKCMDDFLAIYHKDLPYVDVFEKDRFVFRINHNDYKSEYTCKIVHFLKDDDKVLLLVNDQHSVLTVFDAITKDEVASYRGFDDFYVDYYVVGDTLVLYGFIWSPVFFMKILNLKEILKNDEEYEGVDFHIERDEKTRGLISPKVCVRNGVAHTPEEYMAIVEKEKSDRHAVFIAEVNKLWPGAAIFRKVLASDEDAWADLKDAEIASFKCNGGNSSRDYPAFCKPILAENLVKEVWKGEVPDIVSNKPESALLDAIITMVFHENYKHTSVKRYDSWTLDTINLVYTINEKWRVKFVIEMVPIDDKYFKPPPDDSAVKVTITKC